jgi:uncharacterized protein (TIGR01777 family)
MSIIIAGGTGFVGQALTRHFLSGGHPVTAIGRSPKHPFQDAQGLTYICADTRQSGDWQAAVAAGSTVINLAGATIFRRWSTQAKSEIRDSRILTTRRIVEALGRDRGTFLFSASGAGYYGNRGAEALDEDAAPGNDFLADLSVDWEREAFNAADKGVRVAVGRFGVILHPSGGAFPKMQPVFRMGLGGPLGSGQQYFPWIHLDDVVAAVDFLRTRSEASGAYNFCAPQAVTNRDLARGLGRVLKRPAFLPAPALLMRLLLGEFSGVLLGSQRAMPQRLIDNGFGFRYPTLDQALQAIIQDQAGD